MHDSREPHLAALKRILRYVKGTLDLGLHFYASSTTSLVGYIDADWAGCPSTRRSTSGYCVFFGDNLLSWSAKQQHTLSGLSAKAEYRGVANVVVETAWLRNLLHDIMSSKGPSKAKMCREESENITFLECTSLKLSSNSNDIVSREGPSKAIVSKEGPSKELLKWYDDATDEDATAENTAYEDTHMRIPWTRIPRTNLSFQSLKVKLLKGQTIQLQQSSSKSLFQSRDACLD
nr:ribonuclease H-like domain-containing protein [Tanacetum cinerariifolium]